MTSQVDLINQALGQMGAASQAISGISPANPPQSLAAQTASLIFQDVVDGVFRAAHWNVARYQTGPFGATAPPAPLTLLKAAAGTPENPSGTLPQPPVGWRYSYLLPADCLLARFIIGAPQPSTISPPIMTSVGVSNTSYVDPSRKFTIAIDADLAGDDVKVILTNACQAMLVYTRRIANPDLWDPLLRNAVVATLAAWFVNPLNRNAQLLKERVGVAVGFIAQARVSDGNEGVMSMDHMPDWLMVRNAGGAWGDFRAPGEGGFLGGWESIAMPDGVSY
jgi:hypothetical protein